MMYLLQLVFRKKKFIILNTCILIGLYGLITKLSSNTQLDYFSDEIRMVKFEKASYQKGIYPIEVSNDKRIKYKQVKELAQSLKINEINFFPVAKSESVCKLPSLELRDHEKSLVEPSCRIKKNWGYILNQTWHLDNEISNSLTSIKCLYRKIIRVDDFKAEYRPYVELNDGQMVNDDVIEVTCKAKQKNGRTANFQSLYPQIVNRLGEGNGANLINKVEVNGKSCSPLNIIMISYDSVSRVSWLKRLPKTVNYMKDVMKFDILNGYNIVGDGTPAALIPILTGKTEEELPSALKNDPNGKYVDEVYPFIWKDLHKENYMSMYLDDWPHLGCFSYRMRGFKNKTTKHYFKHYQIRLWEQVAKFFYSKNSRLDDFCMGDTKRHKVLLNLIKQFQSTYLNRTKSFVFMHYVENSHDSNERLNWVDSDLLDFLRSSYEENLFNNTAIFLYSDHGVRFTDKSTSNQRYLEERLPFFSIYLPDEYKKSHPDKFKNLQANKNQLTSPFDIYSTILDMTCLDRSEENTDNRQRSVSLLKPISKYRSCDDIGISDHYCVCVEPWEKESVDNYIIVSASQFSVDSINFLTEKVRNLCVKLELKKIISAEKLKRPNNDFITYKIEFITSPNNGIYEVLIYGSYFDRFEFKSLSNSFSIKSRNDISRIDAYGQQPSCVSDFNNNPEFILDLRKFCFCKKQKRHFKAIG